MSKPTMTYRLGDREVGRLGYGAMQLAGPGVFGPVKDEARAIQVLRDAVASGINHIDTSDFYGPHYTNQLIKKALHPYSDDLCIVTKVSARRDEKGGWIPAFSPEELTSAVEDNLRNLGLESMEVVNLRSMLDIHQPKEGSLEPQLETLIKLKERGLIRHIGLSNVTARQVADARKMTPIVCVQNMYNLANRHDDALVDQLAEQGIAYVPFFPLGGFSPLQSTQLNEVAAELSATPMQVALAWLLKRSPNILLIPGTSSPQHLQENLASGQLTLSDDVMEKLNGMGS
ncbi:MAG: aldo/keto reductase family oxidoreductase [Rahnella inusitata]|jgi:pyridoxine 4-dehydrogenase|uniref:aldo/keto reductase family oxidoreductase n=1 Tax=Rahnella inusitata TaxID=58169 RepID=UPI001BC84697|nr:aldo/keto reductase family oxidoreductase [Rahnella inusitata]QUT17721.1 aldo/keto reductase family oxidoreductase [Rahnella inusitata]